MRLGIADHGAQLPVDAVARHVLVEPRRLDDQVVAGSVAHHFAAVGQPLARDIAQDELPVQELTAFLQVHAIGHLPDQVGGADQAADQAVLRVGDVDVLDFHLVAGEVHQLRRDRDLGGEPQSGQVGGDEVGAAADVDLGEHRAVRDFGLRAPLHVAGVVEQRHQHAEHGAPCAELVGRRAAALVAVDEARHGERDVERMPDVVIQRVAGEVAGEAAFEQRAEVVEGARQPNEVLSRVAGGEQGEDRVADPLRILDIYAVRDVVLV